MILEGPIRLHDFVQILITITCDWRTRFIKQSEAQDDSLVYSGTLSEMPSVVTVVLSVTLLVSFASSVLEKLLPENRRTYGFMSLEG